MTEKAYGFPPELRLKKSVEFSRVFSKPQRSTDNYFTVLAIKSNLGHPRVGLAITKKIIRKATNRNVIKRIVRESFRHHKNAIGSVDIVVLVRRDALKANPDHLRSSLCKHWLRLGSKCV